MREEKGRPRRSVGRLCASALLPGIPGWGRRRPPQGIRFGRKRTWSACPATADAGNWASAPGRSAGAGLGSRAWCPAESRGGGKSWACLPALLTGGPSSSSLGEPGLRSLERERGSLNPRKDGGPGGWEPRANREGLRPTSYPSRTATGPWDPKGFCHTHFKLSEQKS